MGCRKSTAQRGICSLEWVYQKKERSEINNLSFHLRKLVKEEQSNSEVCKKKLETEQKSVKSKTRNQFKKSTQSKAGSQKMSIHLISSSQANQEKKGENTTY